MIHAYCVLSNHLHLVVTDTQARLPEFHRYFGGLAARAINCVLGRWESFWDPGSYSAVRLETTDAILEKMVYVLANPVAAGLVRHGRDWPGLWSDPSRIGGDAIAAEQPGVFFRKKGPTPASTSLRLTRPPGFVSDEAFLLLLRERLAAAEDAAAAELEAKGRRFLGAAAITAQKPTSRPAPGEPRRALNPRVACKVTWKRIEALQRLAEFTRAYREALASWRTGLRTVLFPAGTWLMRVQHAAPCAACG
jgi:hypothetical protein